MSERSFGKVEPEVLLALVGAVLVVTGLIALARGMSETGVLPVAMIALGTALALSFLGALRRRPIRHAGHVLAWLATPVLVIDRGTALGINGWTCAGAWLLGTTAAGLYGLLKPYPDFESLRRRTARVYLVLVIWPSAAIGFLAGGATIGLSDWTVLGGWQLANGAVLVGVGARWPEPLLRRAGAAFGVMATAVLVLERWAGWGVNGWMVGGWLVLTLAALVTLAIQQPPKPKPGRKATPGSRLRRRPAALATRDRSAPPAQPKALVPARQRTYATVAATHAPGAAAAQPEPEPERVKAWRVGERVVGLYEIQDVHEQGAMGLVYRVRHLGWDVDLAVKSPRPELFATESDKERFIREAETWVSLGLHPNVCACHYVRTLDGVPRVFAEYVDGGSLRDWIDDRRLYRDGPQPALARILDLAIQTAWGLAHAHGQAVVHQDVKPANVLVAGDGTAKVTDFGLARASGLGGASAAAVPGDGTMLVTVGGMTPAYASPEQAAGSQVGRRSDVWSFAATMLEMFTGEVTWPAGQVAGAALAAYRAAGARADLMVPMPSPVVDVLAACLQDDPADRPASLAAVAARLVEVYQEETGQPYRRPPPVAARLRADELTNRALSLLDLGRAGEAESAFDRARAVDPQHLEATFNAGLLRWRAGVLRDDELVAELEAVRASTGNRWQAQHLLAQVHLERGDPEAARPLLEQAAQQAPDDPQVRADLERARTDAHAIGRTVCTLAGHDGGSVLPTHLSADGCRALSLSRRHGVGERGDVVDVWDARTGRHLRALQHRSDVLTGWGFTESVRVGAVCLGRDGRRTLTGSSYGILHIWDTDAGECRNLDEHRVMHDAMDRAKIESICLADGGRFALSRDKSDNVRLWDLKKGRCLDTQEGTCLAGNGRVAVAGARSGRVLVWDLTSGRLLHRFSGHAHRVGAVGLSPDGRVALSGEHSYSHGPVEHLVLVWDLGTGERVGTLRGDNTPVSAVAVDSDARLALTGDRSGEVHVWEVATGRRLRTLRGHQRPVTAIHLTPDGELVLTGEYSPLVLGNLTIRVWEVATGRCRYTIEEGLCLPSEAGGAFTGDVHGRICAWSAPREPYVCSFHPCRPTAHTELARLHAQVETLVGEAEQAMAEQRMAAAKALLEEARRTPGLERAASVLAPWRRLGQVSRHAGVRAVWPATTLRGVRPGWSGVCVSADGGIALAAHTDDPTVRIWDVSTGRCLRTLTGHTNPVRSLAMSVDGRIAVSGGASPARDFRDGQWVTPEDDNTVRVWDLDTGRCLHVLRGHSFFVESVDISGDGRVALSAGGQDRTVRAWDLTTGRCLRVLETPGREVTVASLSPDGRLALSSGDEGEPGTPDCTIRVWDLASGRCLHVLHGHASAARCIRVTPDARFAVSGTWGDPILRVWDLSTGRCLRILDTRRGRGPDSIDVRASDGVDSLALSRDGRYALTAGAMQEAVRLWDLQTGRCLRTVDVPGTQVHSLCLTADGRYVFARTGADVRVWEVDWELEVRDPADWDDGARPYLAVFLTQQAPLFLTRWPPFAAGVPVQRGEPSWTEDDFQRLLRELRYAGYGWLRPAGVRAELERMARDWHGPPAPSVA